MRHTIITESMLLHPDKLEQYLHSDTAIISRQDWLLIKDHYWTSALREDSHIIKQATSALYEYIQPEDYADMIVTHKDSPHYDNIVTILSHPMILLSDKAQQFLLDSQKTVAMLKLSERDIHLSESEWMQLWKHGDAHAYASLLMHKKHSIPIEPLKLMCYNEGPAQTIALAAAMEREVPLDYTTIMQSKNPMVRSIIGTAEEKLPPEVIQKGVEDPDILVRLCFIHRDDWTPTTDQWTQGLESENPMEKRAWMSKLRRFQASKKPEESESECAPCM